MPVFLFYSVIFIIILLSDIVKEGVIVVDEGSWISVIWIWRRNAEQFVAVQPDEINCQRTQNPLDIIIGSTTFTACKPVRIIKHKNPLWFLELQQRYTIEFRGSEQSGNFTIKHKTLSEIVGELKNGNALCERGIDVAMIAQLKGFEKAGKLEVNDDINYTGFFPSEDIKQIIVSSIDTVNVDPQKLKDSLEYINELAKG